MITPALILNETMTPALSEAQKLVLLMLVRQYEPYKKSPGLWPDVEGLLDAEQSVPTVKTQALKAVLTSMSVLPGLVVESEGTDKQKTFFSTKQNWQAYGEDILTVLFETNSALSEVSFAVVHRTTKDMGYTGYPLISDSEC